MGRTHFAITALALLLFLPHISYFSDKVVFILVAALATYIPDIDTENSKFGKYLGAGIVRFFTKHRGLFHSLTFCIAVSLVLALIFPIFALPFFLGYGLHILADSFTLEGVTPFWPSKKVSSWKIKTGSIKETSVFVFFVILDLVVLVMVFKSIF